MDLMKELLDEGKKTKVTRAAAHAVYHRDYVKTKKKPYRKYDGHKSYEDEEQTDVITAEEDDLTEGMWDFVKGAGRHVGQATGQAAQAGAQRIGQAAQAGAQRVQQGVQNVKQAGQQASQAADSLRLTKLLVQNLGLYFQLTGQSLSNAPTSNEPAAIIRSNRQPAPAPQQPPRSFTQAHKARDMQFASFLPTMDNSDLVTEGAWDFLKGAAGAVGNAVKGGVQAGAQRIGQAAQAGAQRVQQGVQNTVQAGQDASKQADIEATRTKVSKVAKTLVQMIVAGTLTVDEFKRILVANCQNPQLATKAYNLILTNVRKAQ